MNDTVSEEYLTLLRNSRRQMELAQAINQFVERSMSSTYQLQQGDELDINTGVITRHSVDDNRTESN